MLFRDALIRHWPIIGQPIIWRLTYRPIADYYKKLILLSYLSYLFQLRLLSEDSYLLKDCRVETKQKRTQKQSYKTHPLLPETEATLLFQQMTYIDTYVNFISVTCSPHNAKTKIG